MDKKNKSKRSDAPLIHVGCATCDAAHRRETALMNAKLIIEKAAKKKQC